MYGTLGMAGTLGIIPCDMDADSPTDLDSTLIELTTASTLSISSSPSLSSG